MSESLHTEMLNALLDTAVDAIITADCDGIIQSVNHSACKLFGHQNNELVGKNIKVLMPDPWASEHDQYMDNYRKSGQRKIIGIGRDVEGLRKDGSRFEMHLSISEYEYSGEKYYTAIIHDISARKRAEHALNRSQRMEAIGQLTGGIAHDFNNLLTIITGNLELLDMQLESQPKKALVNEALEAAEMGADLTSRLLAFAKRSLLSPEVINLNQHVQSMEQLLARTLGENIEVETSLYEGLWNTRVDPGQIESVILNLAVNARDAMPEGGKLILETRNLEFNDSYVETEVGLEAGRYVCIAVSDSGQGMSPEVRERAFEPFFTTKDSSRGTGLGLSMVYGFAKQSGGHATLYSETGLGTTVNIYLPKFDGESENVPLSDHSDLEAEMGSGQKILVVEDDPKIRGITIQRLEKLNYTTASAKNGEEALSTLKENPNIDLVFTDLVMPGRISGYDLVREIKRSFPKTAALMTSGYAEDLVGAGSLEVSEVKLLRKPYRQNQLAVAIKEALTKPHNQG